LRIIGTHWKALSKEEKEVWNARARGETIDFTPSTSDHIRDDKGKEDDVKGDLDDAKGDEDDAKGDEGDAKGDDENDASDDASDDDDDDN
jgi:hypothetical protein